MKSIFIAASNATLLVMEFGFTGQDLKVVQALPNPSALVITEEVNCKTQVKYALCDSGTASLSNAGAGFPFPSNKGKVTVAFEVTGKKDLVKFTAAQAVKNLTIIEAQVLAAMENLNNVSATVAEFTFDVETTTTPTVIEAEEGAE